MTQIVTRGTQHRIHLEKLETSEIELHDGTGNKPFAIFISMSITYNVLIKTCRTEPKQGSESWSESTLLAVLGVSAELQTRGI